jgi:hypothetical protein
VAELVKDGLLQGDESVDSLRRLGRILTGSPPGPDTDWASMADLARRQGVSQVLFWRLGQRVGDAEQVEPVPQEVMDRLRQDLHAAAVQVMLAEQQLAAVLGALSTAEVPALVVKGAALGSFYPDPALRLYGDLDILVPETQLDMAEGALNGLGYHCFASKAWWLDRFHHLPPMVRESGELLVELHWRLDYQEGKGRLPADDLWARAVPWMVHDQPGLRLDAVDAVLHLCRHAVVQHRAHGVFRSLCDLAQLTKGWGQEEWETLGQRALDYELARPVFLMLILAEESRIFKAPAKVVSTLRPSGGLPESDELMRRLMRSDGATSARVSVGAVQAATEGSLEARLRHLMASLFLPREGMAMVYDMPADSPLIWLAYLWRPLDLLGRYGRSAWRVLRGERVAEAAWQREVWLEHWLRGDEQLDELEEGWSGKA